ncbi:MAG: glycosyltransferase family 4 protein [Mangrovibacterium sp.]
MNIILISNFLNHHQIPFCEEMYKLLGEGFRFISDQAVPDEFIRNGYPDNTEKPYHIKAWLNPQMRQLASKLIDDADVVILGEAPYHYIKNRLKAGGLTFKYAERLFKEGALQVLNPRKIYHILIRHTRYRNKNFHLLAASAYTVNDFRGFFTYPGKKYKWGYFTSVEELDINRLLTGKCSQKPEIIWVARFIRWKHPELVVKLALDLKKKGYSFHITMIGTGYLWKEIRSLVKEKNLEQEISMSGSMSNQRVREAMLRSNIFLFTSDRNEGWGAVLNEAMSSGCAPVASNRIGAAPYLISDGVNGLLFKSEQSEDLTRKVITLLDDPGFSREIARQAYLTMNNLWSPKNAAVQFIRLSESILAGKRITPGKGPCSTAEITR